MSSTIPDGRRTPPPHDAVATSLTGADHRGRLNDWLPPQEAAGTIWTIGHSTRSADEFVAVLKAHGIELVADVRRHPGSSRFPHFGGAALAERLAVDQIDYSWLSDLGGRRTGEVGAEHAGWRNPSFRAYAAYTWTEPFAIGLEQLLHLGNGRRTAVMCSELLWWRCHRALIADVLRFIGMQVIHIQTESTQTVHPYTTPARIVDGELTYPVNDCC